MGAWGCQIFDNDSALDLAGNVADGGGLRALESAFNQVIAVGDDYLDSPAAEEALMAAEIVARLNGKPGPQSSYFETIDAWKAYMRRATNTINYGNTLPLAQGVKFDVDA